MAYAAVCAVAINLLFPDFAHAYVDPSVVTYAVQAIAGVAVAISAVVGVAFRKVRRYLYGLLGIDPTAKMEKDPAFVAFDAAVPDAMGMNPHQAAAKTGAGESEEPDVQSATRSGGFSDAPDLRWPARFAIALAVTLMSVGTLLIVAPLETVAGSASDFFFKPTDIAGAIIPLAVQYIIAIALIVSAFPRKAFTYVISVLFAFGLCCYLQAMALNTGLPLADGKPVDWAQFGSLTTISTLMWLGVLALCVALATLRPRLMNALVVVGSVVLIVVQGAGVGAILTGSDLVEADAKTSDIVYNESGLFQVSPESNVIVFVLDTYDTFYLQKTLKAYPHVLDGFTGFTWYENAVGSMIPTRYAVPYLLTGVDPDKRSTWDEWLQTRYSTSNYLTDIADAGYSIDLYTNEAFLELTSDESRIDELVSLVSNANRDGYLNQLVAQQAFDALLGCALYRDLPWALKPQFRFNTPDVSGAMLAKVDSESPEATTYIHDDTAYFKKLRQNKLTAQVQMAHVASEPGTNSDGAPAERQEVPATGAFKFIHLMGAHYPYNVSLEGTRVKKSTLEDQCAGSLMMVAYYIKELKKLGLYDEATIIVTADHGFYYETLDDLVEPSTPIVLAKPRQSHAAASKPCQISQAPVDHQDIIPTVIKAVGGPVADYAGKPLESYDKSDDPNRPRYYLTNLQKGSNHRDQAAVEWCIRGNALDMDNWSKTGTVFDLGDKQFVWVDDANDDASDVKGPAINRVAEGIMEEGVDDVYGWFLPYVDDLYSW